jgi:transposase InsO family protein
MLGKQLISKSQSQYAAPHFYVEKPETPTTGEYRAVTDFRALNAVTLKNRYPLPRADQLFDKLANAKYFSKIDLRTGFYQILINAADRHKTAFTTSQGLFEYNVLPMGLCNSPGIFMQLMNDTFADFLNKFVLVFLDDIIVYSNSLEEHEQHVRQALNRLRQQRLYAKASKSALCKREVEFLGHMVGVNGLRVMEDKIEAVRDWPTPKNIRELRAFLGLAGYYRRFVRNFSAIALPLTELTRNVTRQKLELSWGAKEQKAFVDLQNALQATPVLVLPDPTKEFVVHCDASGYAIGAVLQQDHGNGLQPVAFMSKKMVGAETRYPVHEQELLAIVTALTTWRHYLEGATHPIRVRTDHKSLTHFQTQPMLSGRQRRWLETLSQFDYTVEYVKGQENLAADALSRRGDHLEKGAPEERPPEYIDPVRVNGQSKQAFQLNSIMVREDRRRLAEFNAIDTEVRRRAARQPELQRVAQRAAANEAATRVIPLIEVAANRPAPDAHGVRVMPTQRCTADNKKREQCGSRTARGRYCHVHMSSKDGLRVKKSTIAGMGLFAARDFKQGEHIADYAGDELVLTHDRVGGEYALALTQRRAIDAARTNTGYGRYANDPHNSDLSSNAEFVINRARGTGRLRATRNVTKGSEILVSYGAAYWRAFGSHAKLPTRPAAAPRKQAAAPAEREVIDLTEISVSTFSSELAAAFDKACKDDPAYADDLINRTSETPRDDPTTEDDVRRVVDEFIVRDGRLFHRVSGCLLVPADRALRTLLIRECHDSATAGHLGRDKTIEQMKRRFTWTKMDQEVELYVKTCEQCQRNKPSQQRTPGLLMPIAPPNYQGHTWSMDFITQLPPCARTGNDAVLVFVCKLTKLKHLVACNTQISAPETARLFLNSVVRLHGMPERIISDRDPRFTAHFWEAFWAGLGTTLSMSTAYHPQTDGQTENANRTLEIMLRSVVNFEQDDWDDHLPAAELAINNARNETTGLSPFYMFYGREARLPLDLALTPLTQARGNPSAADALARWRAALVRAQENTKTAQRRQKKYADEHRREQTFAVGDRVLLATANLKLVGEGKRARKLTERFIGPFRVKAIRNANAYELELPPSMKIHPTINVSQLKPYHDGSAAFPTRPSPLTRPAPAAISNDGAPEWEVERILDHRRYGRRKVLQYLILWKGYPVHEATWEAVEALDGALELVVAYNTRKKIQISNVEALDYGELKLVADRQHRVQAA